jgi:hypothetical protein
MPDYVDEYGGDLQDPKQRCRHGTFIGSWSGPDYLCGWCESGEEPEPPAPTVQCQWIHAGLDYDGSRFDAECLTDAVHRVVFLETFNPEPPHAPYEDIVPLCQNHLLEVFDKYRQEITIDGTTLLRIELGPGPVTP